MEGLVDSIIDEAMDIAEEREAERTFMKGHLSPQYPSTSVSPATPDPEGPEVRILLDLLVKER